MSNNVVAVLTFAVAFHHTCLCARARACLRYAPVINRAFTAYITSFKTDALTYNFTFFQDTVDFFDVMCPEYTCKTPGYMMTDYAPYNIGMYNKYLLFVNKISTP